MCYSTSLRKESESVERRIQANFKIPLLYKPYYHQSGFDHGNLFIVTNDEQESIVPAVWGYVPEFAIDDIDSFFSSYNTLNAKSETIFTSKMYSTAIEHYRCLILADGFFEPYTHSVSGAKYPYFCRYKDDSIFAFAGIYSVIDDDLYSCSIITTEANDYFAEIHNVKKRMPLVLDKPFEKEWLRSDLNKNNIQELMKVGFTSSEFESYTIAKTFNNTRVNRDIPQAIVKVDYPELNYIQGKLF